MDQIPGVDQIPHILFLCSPLDVFPLPMCVFTFREEGGTVFLKESIRQTYGRFGYIFGLFIFKHDVAKVVYYLQIPGRLAALG